MEKIFKSKLFLVLPPAVNLALFWIAGVLLSFDPYVSGRVSNYFGGETTTEYIFNIKKAIGIGLIGLAVSLLVLLVCVLIRKITVKAEE